jgi:F-type H+-transporting ATPase subunit epsilon
MATLKLEIITPEAVVYSEDVEFVLIPAELGEMGIYPMHVPVMTRVNPGELVVTKGSERVHLAVGEGFAEITQTKVCVLADMALEEKHIDEAAAEAAVERARARIEAAAKGGDHSHEEIAATQVMLAKSLAQLKVKRRKRGV